MKTYSEKYRKIILENGGFGVEYFNGETWEDCGLNFDKVYVLDNDLNVAVGKEFETGKIFLLVEGRYDMPYNMCIETKDGAYLFARLNENGKPTSLSFDGKWNVTAVDPKKYVIGDPFATYQDYCGSRPLDYGRVLFNDKMAIDPEGNMIDADKLDRLQEIYDKPTDFFSLKKEDYQDKAFISAAIVAAKNGIRRDVENFKTIPPAYAEWVENFCGMVKETVEETYKTLEVNLESKTTEVESDKAKKNIENILGGF